MRSDIYYGMPVKDMDDKPMMLRADGQDSNYCYDPAEDCALIVRRRVHTYKWNQSTKVTDGFRILTGSGVSGAEVGQEIGWVTDTGLGHRNDYTGRYKIVGIIEPGNVRSGMIPSKKLRHFVMK